MYQHNNQSKDQYKSFLNGNFWRCVRAKAMDKAKHQCEACGRTHSLHAHHVLYRKSWYDTVSDDLLILCERCHNNAHTSMHKVAFIKDDTQRDSFKSDLKNHLSDVFIRVRSNHGAAVDARRQYEERKKWNEEFWRAKIAKDRIERKERRRRNKHRNKGNRLI